jgi:predicted nucleic acid-binding protein
VHWLIEVPAVAARLSPQTAVQDVELLSAMQFPTSDDPNVLLRATALAIETDHHVFDTLYHAVALEHDDSILVTADDRYRRKAERYGMIAALADWEHVS